MQSVFNNRELATLSWLVIFLAGCLYRREFRPLVFSILKHLFARPIVYTFSIAFAYIGSIVYVLYMYDFWDTSLLKATVIWCTTVATVYIYRVHMSPENSDFFSNALRDLVKITIVLEFILSFHALSYWMEFMLVLPVLAVVTIVNAYTEGREDDASVYRLTNWILSLFGLTMLAFAIFYIVGDFSTFATIDTMKDFVLPIVLGLSFLPFVYVSLVRSNYQRAYFVIDNAISDEKLRRYAKWKAATSFRTSMDLLNRWRHGLFVEAPRSKNDVRRSIGDLLERQKIERNPPKIPQQEGWSPYEAKDFLEEYGLPTSYYRPLNEEEWSASSSYIDVGSGGLPNNIAYYVDGNEKIAKKLKLRMIINVPAEVQAARDQFQMLAVTLANSVGGEPFAAEVLKQFSGSEVFDLTLADKRISCAREDWEHNSRGIFEVTFSIEHLASQ